MKLFDEFIGKANELSSKGEPFAMAIVVRYEAPISGKPGNKAIIQSDGKVFGWISGGCTLPVVIKEAKRSLEDGKTRLVRVSPTPASVTQEGIVEYHMSCHSGGTIDVYIEPILPKPQLIIIGRSAIGQTLAKLGKAMNYHIAVFSPGADKENFPDADLFQTQIDLTQLKMTPQTYIVVSTQGEYDEEALEAALKTDTSYVAFIASKKKAKAVSDYLKEKGISADRIERIRSPAGLDIKAQLPEEIAVSILAEIVQVLRNSPEPAAEIKTEEISDTEPKEAIDPICGMSVEIITAKYTSEYQGTAFYFCCAGCKQAFEKAPEEYTGVTDQGLIQIGGTMPMKND